MPISKERFFLGHSLIHGHVPTKVSAKVLESITPTLQIENFGLFNTSAPDFSKYYPGLTPEDLHPTDEDFIYPTVRALSEVVINRYGPVDFSQNGVLKKSMKKLVGQTVYPNHESMVGNELGTVIETYWQKSFTQDGVEIPAGMNARLKIDGKSNPKIARAINSEPPSVHSASVSIMFAWEKSHREMSEDEFWEKLGTYDAKGQLVRRVVEDIIGYEELSMVSHGQDSYAQIVQDGKLTNPQHADSHKAKFSATDLAKHGSYFDWKSFTTDHIKLTSDHTIPNESININNSTKNNEPMNETLLKFFREQLGLAADTPEAQVLAKLQEMLPILLTAQKGLGTANSELTALKAKYPEGTVILSAEDSAKLAEHTRLKAEADVRLTNLRNETIKLYHLSVGGADKADAGVTKLISNASEEAATALYKQYDHLIESTHKLTCQACGSTNINRASSKGAALGVVGGEKKDDEPAEVKDNQEVSEYFTKPKSNTGILYPTKK